MDELKIRLFIYRGLQWVGKFSILLVVLALLLGAIGLVDVYVTRGHGAITWTPSLSVVVYMLGAWCIWIFSSQKKQLILYLRKFGDENANDLLQKSIRRKLRKKYRLVVLDDGKFSSVTLLLRDRIMLVAAFVPMVAVLLALISLGKAVIGTVSGGYNTTEDFFSGEITVDTNLLGDFISGNLYFSMPYGIILWLITLIIIVPLLISVSSIFRGKVSIESVKQLARLLYSVRFSQAWVASPRVMHPMVLLVRSSDHIWKSVVSALIKRADLVVMDLSESSDSLAWEVEICAEKASNKTLYFSKEGTAGGYDVDQVVHYPEDKSQARSVIVKAILEKESNIIVGISSKPGVLGNMKTR